MKHYKMVDDCIVLLNYVAQHREEHQTYYRLSPILGIPEATLAYIINEADKYKQQSLLYGVALSEGFDYKILHKKGHFIDVIKHGYSRY